MDKVIMVARPDGGVTIVGEWPGSRRDVEVTPAVMATRVTRRAVYAMRVVKPAVYAGLGHRRVRLAAEQLERVLVTPEETEEVMVVPARTRPETDEDVLARLMRDDIPVLTKAEYRDVDGRLWPPGILLRRLDVVAAGMPFEALPARVVDKAALPDGSFRDAWTHDGNGGATVDMPRARDIHRGRIRAARTPLLADLDVKFTRATARHDAAAAARIEEERQRLRDAPAHPAIDAAATPDDLKAAWPLATRDG